MMAGPTVQRCKERATFATQKVKLAFFGLRPMEESNIESLCLEFLGREGRAKINMLNWFGEVRRECD